MSNSKRKNDNIPPKIEKRNVRRKIIFEDNELPINSEALPAIWENWEDFVSKSEDFEFALEGIETSTLIDLRSSLGNVGATCGSCHQKYRMK